MTLAWLLMAVGPLLLVLAVWTGPPELGPVGMLCLLAGVAWWARKRSGTGRRGAFDTGDREEAPDTGPGTETPFSGGGGTFGGAGASEDWAADRDDGEP